MGTGKSVRSGKLTEDRNGKRTEQKKVDKMKHLNGRKTTGRMTFQKYQMDFT